MLFAKILRKLKSKYNPKNPKQTMTNITFSESEKSELTHFYELELNKALKKAEDIKTLLAKLKGKAKRVRRTQAQLAAAGAKPRIRTAQGRGRKKAVRAIKTKKINTPWVTFIPGTIKQKGSPMTAREILNIAAKKFNIRDTRRGMKSLSQTLMNMQHKKLVTAGRKKGDRQNYYSLS